MEEQDIMRFLHREDRERERERWEEGEGCVVHMSQKMHSIRGYFNVRAMTVEQNDRHMSRYLVGLVSTLIGEEEQTE